MRIEEFICSCTQIALPYLLRQNVAAGPEPIAVATNFYINLRYDKPRFPIPTARLGPSFGESHASVLFRPLAFFQHLLRWFYEFYHLLALGRLQFLLPFEQFLSRKSTFNCLGRRLKRPGGLHIAHFRDGKNFSFVPRLLPLTVEV